MPADVVYVASEMAPFSKTGGLGDVAGALPRALAAAGHRVMAVTPRYTPVAGEVDTGIDATIPLFGALHKARLYVLDRDGVRLIFVDNPCFHRKGIYGSSTGAWPDNLFRYTLLTRAAILAAARVPLAGGPVRNDAVFFANDWHTALLPLYLDVDARPAGRFRRSGVVLGLHNLGHQGTVPAEQGAGLDLPARAWPHVDMHGRLNPLKAGIVTADALVAVSPTYAREICAGSGFGLDALLAGRAREGALTGILNGVGPEWDPRTDTHLAARYTADDLSGKAVCKIALQREAGLPLRPEVPLIGLVARLDPQKGLDLVEAVLPWLARRDVQMVFLGSGSARFADMLTAAASRWSNKVATKIGFDEGFAHRITAGADLFLMPSRFEPCGLNQMYSLRYGTVPVVHRTGGLADTVQTWDPASRRGNGWAFPAYSADSLTEGLAWALLTCTRFPDTWREIQRQGMAVDSSWGARAARYGQVIEAVRRARA